MTINVLNPGDIVTIWPRVRPGESRDTEGGLQPWKATFLGATPDGRIVVRTDRGTEQTVHAECLRP
jgi:hypothetical protein